MPTLKNTKDPALLLMIGEKKGLLKEVMDLQDKVSTKNKRIAKLNQAIHALRNDEDEMRYNADLTWREKILFVFKEKSRILTVPDVAEEILNKEPLMIDRSINAIIWLNINRMIKNDEMVPLMKKSNRRYFALPEWMQAGKVMPIYRRRE